MKTLANFSLLLFCACLYGQAPTITTPPSPAYQTVSAGAAVSYTCAASGGGTITYKWYNSNPAYTNPVATGATYSFTAAASDTNDSIYCLASNGSNAQSASVILYVVPNLNTPSVSTVENFGTAPAPQVATGLGFNVLNQYQWQFQAAASIGARWVRPRDAGWGGDGNRGNLYNSPVDNTQGEIITFNPTTHLPVSGGYQFPSRGGLQQAIQWAAQYGLQPELTVDFESPWGVIAKVTTAVDNPSGSTTLQLGSVTGGSLTGVIPDNSGIVLDSNGQSLVNSGGWTQGGVLIQSISGTSAVLEQPTTMDVPAGTVLDITSSLYPPVLIAPQTNNTGYISNPSIQAYLSYAGWLGQQCASIVTTNVGGTKCVLELMNEPEQIVHMWDVGESLYANPPAHFNVKAGSAIYLPLAASVYPLPAGVKFGNGFSDLTAGANSIMNPLYAQFLPADIASAARNMAWESVHPYGWNPEEKQWQPDCALKNTNTGSLSNCVAQGGSAAASWRFMIPMEQGRNQMGGVHFGVTETGVNKSGSIGTLTAQQFAQWNVNQFLTMQGNGVSPIIFYMLSGSTTTSNTVEGSATNNFDFFDNVTQAPSQAASALGAIMADVNAIGGTPVAPYSSSCLMPQVSSYLGTWPLATVSIVGSTAGNLENSILFETWQKKYATPASGVVYGTGTNYWTAIASPAAANVTVRIPAGMVVSKAEDMITQTAVSFTQTGQLVTYPVADDVVELYLVPASASTPAATSCT